MYITATYPRILQEFTRANHQLLLEKDVPREIIDKWTDECDQELATTRHRNWLRFRFCYGRRLLSNGIPAPLVLFTETMKTTISPFPPQIDAPVPKFPYGDWLFDADDPELRRPTGAMMTNGTRTDERPPEFEPMKHSGLGIGVQPPDGRNMFPQVCRLAIPVVKSIITNNESHAGTHVLYPVPSRLLASLAAT